jgi:hypothetical protein
MTRLHRGKRHGDAFGQFHDRHMASVLAYFPRRTADAEHRFARLRGSIGAAQECCFARRLSQKSP